MTMANDDQKIDDVDEMFESFVKKKLQQLGIKKAKDERNGAMSELERNMKLRLEKNMADGSKVKKLEHQSEAQTVEEETENWVESSPKVKKSKKDKKEKKKKKKKDKDDKKERNKKPDSKHHKMRHDEKSKDKVEKKDPKTEKVTSVSDKTREQESAKSSGQDVSTNDKKNLPTNGVSTAPKKDIATIKMKIELLKAKSEGERLQEEMNGLLKNATKDDENDNTEVKKEEQEQINEKGVKTEKEISRSRSPLKKSTHSFRKRSKSGSKSPSKKSRRHTKSRSRSPSRRSKHSRHRSRSRSRSRSRRHRGHRSRSRSRERRRRSRSRSCERRHRKRSRRSLSPLISTKDKVRLLEIAKANALAQHKATYTASSVTSMGGMLKSSSMSVTQLTEICKDIASGKEEPSPLSITDEPLTKERAEQLIDKVNAATVHHPFAVRETPITFNIKPVKMATPAPPPVTKALATLTKEFPVSCGQQHRRKEVLETVYGKWEAVAKDEATKNAVKELVNSDKVFLEEENEPPEVDLSSAIADRISAVRQLQDNPASQEAKERMDQAQKRLDSWTKKKQAPGQFTGHTGLTAMPKSVLESGRQAWFKADDLKNAKKVDGIGKSLLQKMGWTPGTPLGKTMLGQLEPLQLDMKNDRRGLSSFMEVTPSAASLKKGRSAQQNGPKPGIRAVVDLSGKHPVSALMEICSKRHWPLPDFHLTDPCNIKSFTYRVTIRNDEYVGHPANNKKQAKLSAATVALQCMGLLPKNPA